MNIEEYSKHRRIDKLAILDKRTARARTAEGVEEKRVPFSRHVHVSSRVRRSITVRKNHRSQVRRIVVSREPKGYLIAVRRNGRDVRGRATVRVSRVAGAGYRDPGASRRRNLRERTGGNVPSGTRETISKRNVSDAGSPRSSIGRFNTSYNLYAMYTFCTRWRACGSHRLRADPIGSVALGKYGKRSILASYARRCRDRTRTCGPRVQSSRECTTGNAEPSPRVNSMNNDYSITSTATFSLRYR